MLLRRALGPAVVCVLAVAGLGCVLLAAQVMGRAPVVPGPSGAARVAVGMLPVALDAALPASLLVGLVSAARSWALGGEWRGLAVSGLSVRGLLPAVLAASMLIAGAQAVLAHHLAPAGRRAARAALVAAASDLGLRAGEPLVLPGGVLRAEGVEGRDWSGVFFVQDEVAMSAARGRVTQGRLVLETGTAARLDGQGTVRFDRARVPLTLPAPRFELAERSLGSLRDLLARKRAKGERAAYETLILYKRTTSALAVPLLAALAVPLGAARARPAPVAVVVLLGWWLCIRVADQAVYAIGPVWAAGLPLGVLTLAVASAWRRWERR